MILLYAALAIAAALGIGGGIGWWKGDAHGEATIQAKWDENKREERRALDAANERANNVAQLYEEAKATQRTRTVYVTKEVSHALEAAPDWAAMPVPRGVLDAISASASAPDSRKPDRAVSVPGAGDQDERATSGGLRVGLGRLRGLFGAASSPR